MFMGKIFGGECGQNSKSETLLSKSEALLKVPGRNSKSG